MSHISPNVLLRFVIATLFLKAKCSADPGIHLLKHLRSCEFLIPLLPLYLSPALKEREYFISVGMFTKSSVLFPVRRGRTIPLLPGFISIEDVWQWLRCTALHSMMAVLYEKIMDIGLKMKQQQSCEE
jgi:hypothetical protein